MPRKKSSDLGLADAGPQSAAPLADGKLVESPPFAVGTDWEITPLARERSLKAGGGALLAREDAPSSGAGELPRLAYKDAERGLYLYEGNSLAVLDAIAAKYPEGRFDCIFADPPYFLSNGGITCQNGRMVKVDKGAWDKSRGPELNHAFNLEWLRRCQRVLKPNGTIWITGTHHVIYSVGYALQQLGFKLLNDIIWEKPNPPPNLSCRYFTHSTEIVLWAAKSEKSKHTFNYPAMRAINGGKQMKSVWRMTAPGKDEKRAGKHPTQKPLALVDRCLRASTNPGDWVLDPFLGSGTTAVAALRSGRNCVGIEAEPRYVDLVILRCLSDTDVFLIGQLRLIRNVRVRPQNDLAELLIVIDQDQEMGEIQPIQTDTIWHETKFVFLSCANIHQAAVVHTTVDVTLQDAWSKAPQSTKREVTHIVHCETTIHRIKKD